MQKLTINIDNPEVEAMLFDLSKNNNKSIDKIVSNIIENFSYLYPSVSSKNKKTLKDFIDLINNKTIMLKDEKITKEWIHKNDNNDFLKLIEKYKINETDLDMSNNFDETEKQNFNPAEFRGILANKDIDIEKELQNMRKQWTIDI